MNVDCIKHLFCTHKTFYFLIIKLCDYRKYLVFVSHERCRISKWDVGWQRVESTNKASIRG